MASSTVQVPYGTDLVESKRLRWDAVWSGVFVFAAIWTVFESLAVAIFGTTFGVGMEVWTVILTIIAMFVAGMETARLAGVAARRDAIAHGLTMFGLSVMGLMVMFARVLPELNSATAPGTRFLSSSLTMGMSWTGFLALFLGWLAAMIGASSARPELRTAKTKEPVPLRPAA